MPTVTEQIIGFEIKGIGDFVRQFSTGTGRAAREFESRMGKATAIMEKAVKKAPEHMFGSEAMKKLQKLHKEMEKSQAKAAAIMHKLSMGNIDKEEKKKLQAQLKREREMQKTHVDQMKDEQANLTRWGQTRKKAAQEVNKILESGAREQAQSLADGIEGALGKLEGARMEDIFKGIGSGLGKGAKGLSKAGGKMQQAEGATKAMQAMGSAAKIMGATLGAIAGIAAILGAVIALFLGLDKKVKDLNKTIMQGSGAMDLMFDSGVSGAARLEDRLKNIRDAATDTRNNLKWMTTGKEQMEILAAFQEGGVRIKDIAKGAKDAAEEMQRYQDATAIALTYSRLLGVEANQFAQDMAKYASSTGLTLQQVAEGFSKVSQIAQMSGFNVKRFYSTVLEATSGMHFYNMRVEEAAELLKNLSNMLGKDMGAKFMTDIQTGFKEMSYKERYKQLMITGSKATSEIFKAEAEKARVKFQDTLGKNMQLTKALGGDKEAEKFVKRLGKMSGDEFGAKMAELQAAGVEGEVRNQIEQLRDLSKAEGGGLGAKAEGLDALSAGGTIATQITWMGKKVHELSGVSLMAFEETTGISGSQLKQLRVLSARMDANFKHLQRQGDSMKSLSEKEKELLKYAAETGKTAALDDKLREIHANMQDQVRQFGFFSDVNGKIYKATVDSKGAITKTLDKSIDNFNEFAVNQDQAVSEQLDQQVEQMTKDQLLAQGIVANTEPLAKILEIGIEGILMDIYEVMRPIGGYILEMIGWLDSDAKDRIEQLKHAENIVKSNNELHRDNEKRAKEALATAREQAQALREMAASAETPAEQKRLKEALADAEDTVRAAEANVKLRSEAGRAARGFDITKVTERMDPIQAATTMQKNLAIEAMNKVKADPSWKGGLTSRFEGSLAGGKMSKLEKAQKEDKERRKISDKETRAAYDNMKLLISEEKDLQKRQQEFEKGPGADALAKKIGDENYKRLVEGALAQIGVSPESTMGRSIIDRMLSGDAKQRGVGRRQMAKHASAYLKTLNPEQQRAAMQWLIPLGVATANELGGAAAGEEAVQAQDFIVTDSGRLIQPSSADTLMGLKPGGPIAEALAKGGGKAQINVTIYESHNTEKTYATVKRALRDAGLTN